jgi:hypothetical protein
MSKDETVSIIHEKGVNKILFEDSFKQQCSLQKSFNSLENEIWFGVDIDIIGKTVNSFMHLTQIQIKQLLPYLQKFSETGELNLNSNH